MLRRLADRPGLVFLLVFAWKLALLVFTAQPVPANDSFFYDGPVVNLLLHGKYVNPSLIQALPISGGEVFSAYPPLHQAALLGWMSVCGTSALSAMWFHLVLIGIYMLIVLAILRRLQLPAHYISLAGLFLFSITFHDRPDTLAHGLGMLAIYSGVRFCTEAAKPRLAWLAATFLLLAFCTSLQVGGVYFFCLTMMLVLAKWANQIKFPWAAAMGLLIALVGLGALVRFGFPHLWQGFQEHVRITPSVTGLRVPGAVELLKAARTAPAIFVISLLVLLAWVRRSSTFGEVAKSASARLCAAATFAALALIAASLLVLTPNTIHVANYLQPIIVGAFLGSGFLAQAAGRIARPILALFVACALVTSLRAAGMSTWGVLCARDVSYADAMTRLNSELDQTQAGQTVIVSAAYLYETAKRKNLRWVHSDWPEAPRAEANWEYHAFVKLKPARIIVTQFDYYRRFGRVIEELKNCPQLATLDMTNTARVPPPDAFPNWQRVIQHVSWAPVIVDLKWR